MRRKSLSIVDLAMSFLWAALKLVTSGYLFRDISSHSNKIQPSHLSPHGHAMQSNPKRLGVDVFVVGLLFRPRSLLLTLRIAQFLACFELRGSLIAVEQG